MPDYQEAIRRCASLSAIDGMVYDASLLKCACKAGVERVYTFNIRPFKALEPDLARIVCAPLGRTNGYGGLIGFPWN